MDIGTIAPSNRKVRITHPGTGDELGLEFELRSPHHPDVRKVQRDWQNAKLRKKNMDITVEEFEAVRARTLAAHVEQWEFTDDETTINGEQPEFSRDTCLKLIKNHEWIREWLDVETGNAARFYEGSATS